MKINRMIILSITLCLLPMLVGLILYSSLPDMIPVHFDINNNPDNWYPKSIALFGIPLILTLIDGVCIFFSMKDLKNTDNHKMMSIVIWIIPILGIMIYGLMISYSLDMKPDVGTIVKAAIALMFIILGNYLPKARQSYTVGIRLPWTLNDQENWRRTHRLAGYLWMSCGMIMLVTVMIDKVIIFSILLVIMFVVPIGYSYCLSKRK